ncbi:MULTISPECIES: GNAT family N-acetyltransferase [Streptomycetaceae]|uniref:GNAT family N-acetyltransferase n=1 Tax=Streptomycetaceae TaxID=2062 RepID=UPI0030097D46
MSRAADSDLTVIDVPAAHRYEARAGDNLAGVASYLRGDSVIAFVHTEVQEGYEGRGVGSALARAALDDARARGLGVLAICPFIDGWIGKHPEYEDLRHTPESKVAD